jgi:hypothetical protein
MYSYKKKKLSLHQDKIVFFFPPSDLVFVIMNTPEITEVEMVRVHGPRI